MPLFDLLKLGMENLWQSKLRTALTILGVVVGIGALTSMVSFGTGMQKNVIDAFKKNDLFSSLYITPAKIDLEDMASGDVGNLMRSVRTPLTDSTLMSILSVEGVQVAFPEIRFPVKLRFKGRETRTHLQALPVSVGGYPPFDRLQSGRFFRDDTCSEVVVSWNELRELGLPGFKDGTGEGAAAADTLLGCAVEIVSAVLDFNALPDLFRTGVTPTAEIATPFRICGLWKQNNNFTRSQYNSGVFIPLKAAERVPRLSFSSVWDILGRGDGGYPAIYVRAETVRALPAVRKKLEAMDLNVFTLTDELKEIRRGFLILDSMLGAIGTIALFVAALGIINTMVMSILERTREIGIMKAIGAGENEIKLIFFTEAGVIGAVGALFGLVLGWIVTRIANLIANTYLRPAGDIEVDLFYFPVWLVAGAILFSILISLAAGLYPAARAARIDPVEALRHD